MSKRSFTSIRGKCDRCPGGFTLLEMLVSVTVLVLMLVLFAQITSMTANTTMLANRQIDISMQTRDAFDKLSGQVNSLMEYPGLFVKVSKNTGNDEITFITNSRPSSTGTDASNVSKSIVLPRCAIAGYKVAPDPTLAGDAAPTGQAAITGSTVMLNCGTRYVGYENNFSVTSGNGIDLLNQIISPPSLDWQALAPNIFRFEICFLLSNGTTVANPPQDVSFYSSAPLQSGTFYAALSKQAAYINPNVIATNPGMSNSNPNGLYVKAVIIGVAGFSSDIRKIAGDLTDVIGAFPDVNDGETPLQKWSVATVTSNLQAKNIPRPVMNSYRVYQRYFYVN